MKTIRASRRSLGMDYAIREVTVPAAEAEKAGMNVNDIVSMLENLIKEHGDDGAKAKK